MAGAKFQYDESGGTFFYFLLSFLALVVIPCTYYFWPKDEKGNHFKFKSIKSNKMHFVNKENLSSKRDLSYKINFRTKRT